MLPAALGIHVLSHTWVFTMASSPRYAGNAGDRSEDAISNSRCCIYEGAVTPGTCIQGQYSRYCNADWETGWWNSPDSSFFTQAES